MKKDSLFICKDCSCKMDTVETDGGLRCPLCGKRAFLEDNGVRVWLTKTVKDNDIYFIDTKSLTVNKKLEFQNGSTIEVVEDGNGKLKGMDVDFLKFIP